MNFGTAECGSTSDFQQLSLVLLMAISGSSDHLRATSGLPPTGDIRWLMSVIVLISSALPPAPDVGGTPGECLKLTRIGHNLISRSSII